MNAKSLLGGFLLAAALAAGGVPSLPGAPIAIITSNEFVIRGEVTSRAPIELTVVTPESKVARIQVTDSTTITKAGITLKLSDIRVGDKVTATVMRDGANKLQAVRLTVDTGDE
ncbi:MAG TPA: hypothetical protein VHE13_03745 [Opitutus sp.]|nr:hypothetical protein [Opitutus sp.]